MVKKLKFKVLNNLFVFDNKLREQFNVSLIAGVDEVGRGCLSGPIVAASVIFDENIYLDELKESKSVSHKKRLYLFKIIKKNAISISCSVLSSKEIDKLGLTKANYLVMKNAVDGLSVTPQLIFVDGHKNPYIKNQLNIIKGDKKSAVIAASSIIAKVIRDSIMLKYHKLFSIYNFIENKGYPTKEHINAIKNFGCCEIHRYYAYRFL